MTLNIPHTATATPGFIQERQKIQAIVSQAGSPVFSGIPADQENDDLFLHPVFLLAEHIRGNDSGTGRPGGLRSRGDVMSIPAYSETSEGIFLIEIGFHKGTTVGVIAEFPEASDELITQYKEILVSLETR